jgi:phospholipid/cholesterol/gamma-HCH transport system substrate-binding protein
MKRLTLETAVGVFLLVGIACFFYLAIKLGDLGLGATTNYRVSARFDSIEGLKEGASVEIAGVRVGKVEQITLDVSEFQAVVEISVANEVLIQEDAIASVRSEGILGGKFIRISPGGAEELIEAGGEMIETESSVSLEELLSKYIFESSSGD